MADVRWEGPIVPRQATVGDEWDNTVDLLLRKLGEDGKWHVIPRNLNVELLSYIGTALWSSIDELPDGNGGQPMDVKYDHTDLAPETVAKMQADLNAFLLTADAVALDFWRMRFGEGQIGHDFWLTRNHHGAGFWDRCSGGIGKAFGQHLTEVAEQSFGDQHLYAQNGKVYCE